MANIKLLKDSAGKAFYPRVVKESFDSDFKADWIYLDPITGLNGLNVQSALVEISQHLSSVQEAIDLLLSNQKESAEGVEF